MYCHQDSTDSLDLAKGLHDGNIYLTRRGYVANTMFSCPFENRVQGHAVTEGLVDICLIVSLDIPFQQLNVIEIDNDVPQLTRCRS